MQLVDGKQRLEAVRRFLRGDLPAFGLRINEFEDAIGHMAGSFRMHVNELPERTQVLNWYIELNAGGVAHTEAEIEKVRAMLAAADAKGAK